MGPNGAGKSALFDAILNFSMLARGNIAQAFSPYPFSFGATRYRAAAPISRIGFRVEMSERQDSQAQLDYRIDYAQQGAAEAGRATFQIFDESLASLPGRRILFDRSSPESSSLGAAIPHLAGDRGILAALRAARLAGAGEADDEVVGYCTREVSRFNKFRLNPGQLAAPSRLPELAGAQAVQPRIGYEGDDLSSCLFYMYETNDPALEIVRKKVQALVHEFEDFEFTTVGVDRVGFSMRFNDGRQSVPAVRASHGLLLFTGLMVLTYSQNRPPLMLIEEPENGLTPTAVRAFYQAVRELAFREDASQRSQVVISSHSPFVICEAWNGEDREFIHQVKVENGRAVARKFSDAVREQGVVLGKDAWGDRTRLGLKSAEELMSGYLA